MFFAFKNYKLLKISRIVKYNNFIFITQSINKNSKNLIKVNQSVKKTGFQYFKTVNKIANLSLKTSLFKKLLAVNKSSKAFLIPKTKQLKHKNPLIISLNKLAFYLELLLLNNKVYATANIKAINFFSYQKNCIQLQQALIVNIKMLSSKAV